MQAKIDEFEELMTKEARSYLKRYSRQIVQRAVAMALDQLPERTSKNPVEHETQRRSFEKLLDRILGDPSTSGKDVNITVGLPRGMTEDDF